MNLEVNLELAERIRSVRFTPVRIREGYAMDVVDDLLDELEQAASRGAALQPLVDRVTFPTVKWREGYDMVEVDRFLVELTSVAPLAPRSPTDPAHAPAFPVESPVESPGRSPVENPVGRSVIEEQHGLLHRLFRRK